MTIDECFRRDRHPFSHPRGHDGLRARVLAAIGRGGHAFGDDGPHGGGWGSGHGRRGPFGGRKFRSGELQLVILALLAEAPAHGYELIRRLETRSNGFYGPSPGVIYPALAFLEETDLIEPAPEAAGTRKPFRLTAAGQASLAARRAEADGILASLDRSGARMGGVREAWAAEAEGGDELHRARAALKRALLAHRGADEAERRRIAAILEAAASAIGGGER